MEAWVPLFEIFLTSPSPESEASLWLHQSFGVSSSATIPTTASSFVSLLMKPMDAIVVVEGSLSPSSTRRVMFVQTLPNMVQARILSFLSVERHRFCRPDLVKLARTILSCSDGLDFWVERAARNLLDVLSGTSYEWISSLSLDSGEEERVVDEFESVPSWLKDKAGPGTNLLPWLPVSYEDLMSSRISLGDSGENVDGLRKFRDQEEEEEEESMDEVIVEVDRPVNDKIEPEVLDKVASLKARIKNLESASKTIDLANEIQKLCHGNKRGDSLAILGLIEPWLVDDETASILITHFSDESEEQPVWTSQVLCSIVLPKLLVLEEPASRVLLAATIHYCKVHHKAAEYSLLLPLILRRNGINNPICDLVTKIVKECLHTAHASALFQKLLCGGKWERRVICLPCHSRLVSDELVWTESLFNLFQNILNHNVCLSKDSVDHIVHQVQNSAEEFSKSLKFGHFLLCLVNKCSPLLKSHKITLTEAAGRTHTLVTKSILSKLASI